MKTILTNCFGILLLLVFISGCQSEESPALSGRVTSTGYENEALGMRISFSSSWRSVSAIPDRQETPEEREGFLFSIQKPIDPDGSGPVLTAIIQHAKVSSAEEHLKEFLERRRRTRPESSIGDVRSGQIADRDFAMVAMEGDSSIAYFVTLHRDYVISFVGIYGNSVEFDEIRRILHSLSFS